MREVLLTIALVILFYVTFVSTDMVGKGTWYVISVDKCAEDSLFNNKFEVSRRKMDRTHDGFNVTLNLADAIDDSIAIRMDVCLNAEGGCKPYQVMADECLIKFCNKFAEQNIINALTLAGLDPPEFPINKGQYKMVDYIFDYSEMPEEGPYGVFGVQTYLIKNQREIGCIDAMIEFKEIADDGDEEEE